MLRKKSQRQPRLSVIQPPIAGPSVGASVDITPSTASAPAASAPSKKMKPVANASGIIAPPTKPWMARNTTIDGRSQAAPHARLVTVKAAAEATNTQRVDKACAR